MSAAGPSTIKSATSDEPVKPASPVTASASVKPIPVQTKLLAGPTLQAALAMPQAAVSNVTPPVAPLAGAGATSAAVQTKPAIDGVQQSSHQVLAQAQSLWNEGARASAIDLLRQALSRIEVASQGSVPGVASVALAAVVRELAGMELAEAQVSNALKLLQRLEPQIGQVADLWAMRGNAAQRLGQHAEAVSSYQRAVSIKPDEPRWLLGLAVSLAAQGQTTQAADLTEKVRVMGALRPEIANYLRQLGVVIRTD
jgi:tetratricopeptide (TPR) repeat protein